MADQKQARIYLEATPEGYPLYRKCGWRDVEDIVMDYSVYGGGGRGHICSDDSGAGPPPSSQLRTEDLAFCTRHSTERICWTVHITPYHRDCHQ